jgi:hypothetical protein
MKRIKQIFGHVMAKLVVAVVVVSCLAGALAYAEKWIAPGSPAGSCCSNPVCVSKTNPNGEGSSTWSTGAQAWSCRCDSSAVPINPGPGPGPGLPGQPVGPGSSAM